MGTTKAGCRDPVDPDALDNLSRRQARSPVVVTLLTGDDPDGMPSTSQVEGEIAEDLGGRRLIGIEKAVDEDDPGPPPPRRTPAAAPMGHSSRAVGRATSMSAGRLREPGPSRATSRGAAAGIPSLLRARARARS